jgi:hypothetical protein
LDRLAAQAREALFSMLGREIGLDPERCGG